MLCCVAVFKICTGVKQCTNCMPTNQPTCTTPSTLNHASDIFEFNQSVQGFLSLTHTLLPS